MLASDYDGTFQFLTEEQRLGVDFIITGNGWDQYGRLYDDGVRIPVFWNPDKEELMQIVLHKASIINKTGVSLFYEDQQVQLSMMKTLCPKCQFVLITGGRK